MRTGCRRGRVSPRRPHREAEIITYVRERRARVRRFHGRSGVIQAGEFQRTTAGRGSHQSETNASRTDWAEVFQICLRPAQAGLEPGHEQKRFSAAERRGGLCSSPRPTRAEDRCAFTRTPCCIRRCSARGSTSSTSCREGRSAWLHLIEGEVTLGDVVLSSGDGAGLTAERAVSLTAREETEILLFDLGAERPRSYNTGGVP